jgi:hypothetical protein
LCLAYVLLVSHNRKFKLLAWEGFNNIPPEERNGCVTRLTTELTAWLRDAPATIELSCGCVARPRERTDPAALRALDRTEKPTIRQRTCGTKNQWLL